MQQSSNTIDFTFDATHEVVIVRPRWTLRTREDVAAWHQCWISGLKPFAKKGKPDVVVVLDNFHVAGEAVAAWGELRADLNNNHMGISFRVNPEMVVRATILTSGIKYDTATAEAVTVADAVEGIVAARKLRHR